MDSPKAKAFQCNDKDHSWKDHGYLNLSNSLKFNEPMGTAAERQDMQPHHLSTAASSDLTVGEMGPIKQAKAAMGQAA